MKSLKKGGSGREGGERTEDDNSAPSSITHSFAVYKSKDFEKKGLGGMVFSMMCHGQVRVHQHKNRAGVIDLNIPLEK